MRLDHQLWVNGARASSIYAIVTPVVIMLHLGSHGVMISISLF